MLTADTRFEFELKKIIDVEIDRIKDILAAGVGVPDFSNYQRYVGEIAALRRVSHAYCDEVNDKINKRD